MNNNVLKPKASFQNTLMFTPYAWGKLLWMRDYGNTEVAGYCITGTDDPLFVTDFQLIKQKCTSATFDIDPEDGVDFVERMMDINLMPWQCQRILAHTHPGNSPIPSQVDEENFQKAFSAPDWAIMLIIAKEGEIYCRIKFNVGPGGTQQLKVAVDFSSEFQGSNHEEWQKEYQTKVHKESKFRIAGKEGKKSIQPSSVLSEDTSSAWWDAKYAEYLDQNDREYMESIVQNEDQVLEDLECFWNTQGDVEFWNNDEQRWYTYDPIRKKWYIIDNDDDQVVEINPNDYDSELLQLVVKWADKYSLDREDNIWDPVGDN